MESNAVELRRISKSFSANGKVEKVLNQINGTVQTGAILNILGPSGSGKSTILSMCNLLLAPDEGEVYIHGKEVRKWNIPELRQKVGIAFQSAPMIPGTVLDNLMLPANIHQMTIHHPLRQALLCPTIFWRRKKLVLCARNHPEVGTG